MNDSNESSAAVQHGRGKSTKRANSAHPYPVVGEPFAAVQAPVQVCADTSPIQCVDESEMLLEAAKNIADLVAEQLADPDCQLSANTPQAAQCICGVMFLIEYARGFTAAVRRQLQGGDEQ
ncbi:hypothetical protein [Tahibacter harae]|uniref:DUF3077 family protein n=1 Tax=Tahibacter harae TaxID=2963937 RepID=A0ABT1QQV7_9GAMM|nr:hypothetical protein [Tahibacter harae]MCQ4164690.1 hypothetical protein [Tahibacter harae]